MKTPLIILAASGICGVLAWGICGSARGQNEEAMLGIALFGLSALGLLLGVVWLLVALVNKERRA